MGYLTQAEKDAVIASDSGTATLPMYYAYPTSIALTSADERRFREQPEQLDQLDSSLFCTIVLFICSSMMPRPMHSINRATDQGSDCSHSPAQ